MLSVVRGVWKTIQIVFLSVVGFVLLCNLYVGFSRLVLGNEYPTIFGLSSSAVVSGSMSPTIEKGDLILVSKKSNYQIGDIVSFKDEIGVVTHRIVEKTENGYITWGDNREINNAPDREILASEVYGKVIKVIPSAGNFIQFLKTPVGIISTLMLLILVIIIPIIFDKIKESEAEEQNVKNKVVKKV